MCKNYYSTNFCLYFVIKTVFYNINLQLLIILIFDNFLAPLHLSARVTVSGGNVTVDYSVSESATCTCQLNSETPVSCKICDHAFIRHIGFTLYLCC